jgi:hypothetical protein
MEIGSGPPIQTQIEAMKKAEDVQEQTISKLLQDSSQQLQKQQKTAQETQEVSGAALTGLGTGIDITG